MELSLLILVCIHKSYDLSIYLEICVVPIGHGFSFFGHGKSMLKKGGTLADIKHTAGSRIT